MTRRLTAAVAAALLLSACVEGSGPDPGSCAASNVEIELALSDEGLDPADPAVCRGQEVTLTISPQVDGVFHIHGYDEQVPATEVRAGEIIELPFTAARSGQFPIELHPKDDPVGVDIGVFTVHEP